ncbi:MAG: hypothetical protein M3O70_15840 [Actinomycetota bacterium]|nr:hypothetical protein [Actinomycetota bacterium]
MSADHPVRAHVGVDPPPAAPSISEMRVAYVSGVRPGKARNEDFVACFGSAAWVLDGSSVPPGLPSCCELDAHWYVTQLSAAIAAALVHPAGRSLAEVVAEAIAAVRDKHHALCRTSASNGALGPSATMALVRLAATDLEYFVLGDSSVFLDTDKSAEQISDRRLASVAAPIRHEIREHLRAGHGYESSRYRTFLRTLIEAERQARNVEGGYWIAADDPAAAEHAMVGTRPIGKDTASVRRLALLTDGMERVLQLFRVYPCIRALLDALDYEGPKSVLDAVRHMELADPDGTRHPRTSRADDATALIWRLA